jgi:Dihaem cytochrome c
MTDLREAAPGLRKAITKDIPSPVRTMLTAFALTICTSASWADSGRLMPATVPQIYAQECASCHTAYPPGMLPGQSWQRILSTLEQHYGSDASTDEESRLHVSTWLIANAGTYKRAGSSEPPEDRLTRSAWFQRKHRKIDIGIWSLPSVKSAAQCGACHLNADKGLFSDHDLRIPAGVSTALAKPWRD